MRTIVLLIASMLFLCFNLSAQKIKIAKDEVDKFNGYRVTSTKMELFCFKNVYITRHHSFHVSLRMRNEKEFLIRATIVLPDIEKYDAESGVTLLTSQGNSVVLYTMYTGIGGYDSSLDRYSFDTVFMLSPEEADILSSEKITDVRIRYFGGHFDMEVQEKKQDLIIRMFQAIAAVREKK